MPHAAFAPQCAQQVAVPNRNKPASAKKTVDRPAFENHARAEWDKLDEPVKEPLRHLLKKRLDAPHLPTTALHRDLANCYRIKLLKQG